MCSFEASLLFMCIEILLFFCQMDSQDNHLAKGEPSSYFERFFPSKCNSIMLFICIFEIFLRRC